MPTILAVRMGVWQSTMEEVESISYILCIAVLRCSYLRSAYSLWLELTIEFLCCWIQSYYLLLFIQFFFFMFLIKKNCLMIDNKTLLIIKKASTLDVY